MYRFEFYYHYITPPGLLLSGHSSDVEGEFFTFQNVPVTSTRLTGSRRNASVQLTGGELRFNTSFDLGGARSRGELSFDLLRSLGGLFTFLGLTQDDTVVVVEPLLEGGGVDLDDGRLGQGVGSDQFVVRRVVDDRGDSRLSGDTFRGPREVTGFNTQSSELLVTTSGSDGVDSLGAQLGRGGLTAQFELPLLTVLGSLGTGGRSLVTRISGNTHGVSVRESVCGENF